MTPDTESFKVPRRSRDGTLGKCFVLHGTASFTVSVSPHVPHVFVSPSSDGTVWSSVAERQRMGKLLPEKRAISATSGFRLQNGGPFEEMFISFGEKLPTFCVDLR